MGLKPTRCPFGAVARQMWPWIVTVVLLLLIAVVCTVLQFEALGWPARSAPVVIGLTALCHLIESVCLVYAACFVFATIRYTRVRNKRPRTPDDCQIRSRVAVLYLCCGDLDEAALESLSNLRYTGRLIHLLHDDSTDENDNRLVDQAVVRLRRRTGAEWRVMRRADKGGGKPGAVQHVLNATADEHDFFLLADNDSYANDLDVIENALMEFADPNVAGVQFRNRTRTVEEDGTFARTVAAAVDVFDIFLTGLFRPLWQPFVGHNALLDTRAVMDVGGMTPGMFADDIDLTVRLNMRGRRIVFRRDLEMQERHPEDFRSFCLRSKKWATGCAQVVRAHLLDVLGSPVMTAQQKLGFVLFTGFYFVQMLVLIYIGIVFFALPVLGGDVWTVSALTLVFGTIVPLTIFLPIAVYLLTEGRSYPFWRTLIACAGTYGATDLWTALGLRAGFSSREHRWIPTNNASGASNNEIIDWGHFVVGTLLLVIPLLYQPVLLLYPVTWLFSAKLLFVPAVSVNYAVGPPRALPSVIARFLRTAIIVFSIGLATMIFGVLSGGRPEDAPASEIKAAEGALLVNGEPLLIKGIHYSPWRPGTGPGRGFDYPDNKKLAGDLDLIADANANTILVYDPPGRLLDLAHDRGLHVIYVFNIEWWRLPDGQADQISETIVERVEQLKNNPAVLIWMLGNEVPGWVIDALTTEGVRETLSSMRSAIREVDPAHPISYGNWPLHRTLDLDRDMDILCFNVYPFYPTEVVILGYSQFIKQEIMPLAKGRPFILTEFGVNTIESSPPRQAEVLRECWRGLLDAGAAGGVVFEFADEWWKNYDNPIQPPDWWRRTDAPDDHLTDDEDPEEHYGIVTAEREPKPAYDAVREMFEATGLSDRSPKTASLLSDNNVISLRALAWGISGAMVAALIAASIWFRWRPTGHKGRES